MHGCSSTTQAKQSCGAASQAPRPQHREEKLYNVAETLSEVHGIQTCPAAQWPKTPAKQSCGAASQTLRPQHRGERIYKPEEKQSEVHGISSTSTCLANVTVWGRPPNRSRHDWHDLTVVHPQGRAENARALSMPRSCADSSRVAVRRTRAPDILPLLYIRSASSFASKNATRFSRMRTRHCAQRGALGGGGFLTTDAGRLGKRGSARTNEPASESLSDVEQTSKPSLCK